MPVRKISLPDDGVETFFGTHDENLRHLETLFGVEIRTDGHGLLVDGDGSGAERVDRFVSQVAGLMKDGYKFAPGEVKTAASLIAEDPAAGVGCGDCRNRTRVRAADRTGVAALRRGESRLERLEHRPEFRRTCFERYLDAGRGERGAAHRADGDDARRIQRGS